jgi:hypothetical protein
MGIERTLVDVFERLSVVSPRKMSTTAGVDTENVVLCTYPGSFNVLFIEYAKCFPTEVNRSGR